MIIGSDKGRVIENIQAAVKTKDFNRKVETGDPELTQRQKTAIAVNHMKNRDTLEYRLCNICARAIEDTAARFINKDTKVVGLKKLSEIDGGAIVTSNHFNPIDTTIALTAVKKAGYKRLYIVSQETNLAMKGWIGFLMKHTDIIPITDDTRYVKKYLEPEIKSRLESGQLVLIYPEQEMWFNYRKPRPFKRGAYLYAAKNNAPIISCFTEIVDMPQMETEEFHRTKYILHILDPIFPSPEKSVRENSIEMMNKDFLQKKAAYEKAYKRKLDFNFESSDIAGWSTNSKHS